MNVSDDQCTRLDSVGYNLFNSGRIGTYMVYLIYLFLKYKVFLNNVIY